MLPDRKSGIFLSLFVLFSLFAILPNSTSAYPQYDNCSACHGSYTSDNYISPSDGQNWGNLHDLHRGTMLNGDCNVCHQAGSFDPVLTNESAGGAGLPPISCVGCHGREEDDGPGNPSGLPGLGAGLRQRHVNSGVTLCNSCHGDASPASYTPVGEEILPPYYADPGVGHPAIPTGPCNDDGSEDFAGSPAGLDNDGDLVYDTDDPGCDVSAVPGSPAVARLLQNHPNPFNPSTNIRYVVEKPGHVLLQVLSVTGDLVRTLVNVDHDQPATYQVSWHGQDEQGRTQPSGIYFYRLDSPNGVEMKKMVLLK